jgi:hypothetical protein
VVLETPSVYMYGCALLMPEQMVRVLSYSVFTGYPSWIDANVYERSISKTGANILAPKTEAHQRNMKHFLVY